MINPSNYTYTRNERNILLRNDNVLIPEDDPNNVAYVLYLEWLKLGNKEPAKRDVVAGTVSYAPDPNKYSYTRNKHNWIVRNDGVIIPEDDPNNPAYLLYLGWLNLGYKEPAKHADTADTAKPFTTPPIGYTIQDNKTGQNWTWDGETWILEKHVHVIEDGHKHGSE